MPITVICIGDPHIKTDNVPEVDRFINRVEQLVLEKKPDICLIMGDVLDTHERLHIIPLNKAYEFIDKMRKITKTYVLVGNHDILNNQTYLNPNGHWMSALKEWKNITIVDKVICEIINDEKIVFVPYVPNGRFQEALSTLDCEWEDASCIFAHQEFAGCKMGAITSIDGDKWPLHYPHVVSGHIHSRQIPQENVYYMGSAMQNAFGESEKNIIAYLTIEEGEYEREEIDLQLPRKKIVYKDVEDIEDYKVPENSEDKIKLTVSGVYDQFKAFKKTKKYKDMVDSGVKVIFKPKKIERKKKENGEPVVAAETDDTSFKSILTSIINEQKNPFLCQAFELVVNGKEIDYEDILFL